MSYSMTAFSRASGQTPWGEITCELRSVNHRYLEINPRLFEEVRHLEPQIRDTIVKHLKRGRVDCTIRLQQQEVWTEDIEVNEGLVRRLLDRGEQIRQQSSDIQPFRVIDLLSWPGVVRSSRMDEGQVGKITMECVLDAVRQLVDIRKREGARLLETLLEKLEASRQIVSQLKTTIPELQEMFRQRIEKRLVDARVELDATRLEQELVVYVQKADVTEEMDRLQVHLDEVSNVFKQKQPVGRRLDFLMQELNRETNTLGSKSIDARLTQASVDLKVLIEQMREQIQNIE